MFAQGRRGGRPRRPQAASRRGEYIDTASGAQGADRWIAPAAETGENIPLLKNCVGETARQGLIDTQAETELEKRYFCRMTAIGGARGRARAFWEWAFRWRPSAYSAFRRGGSNKGMGR